MEDKDQKYTNRIILAPPYAIIKENLGSVSLTEEDLRKRLGLNKSRFELLQEGKSPITESIASQLSDILHIPKKIWIKMQKDYEYDKEWIKRNINQ